MLSLLIDLHGIYPAAERVLGGDLGDQDSESEGDGEAVRVGAPKSESKYRQEERRRHRKMRVWLSNQDTSSTLALWRCLATPLMRVHYDLFKHGTIHCHMSDKPAMLRCASVEKSPVLAVMSSISLAMDETLPKHNVIWRPLLDKFGKVEQWPASLLRKACQCQNLILGGIWRRFYLRLAKVPPWSLVKIADPSIPEEERRKAAEEFLSEATAECCLDPYFAKCLRDMCGNADDLMLESIQRFLLDCFRGALAATTHAEDQFAHMRRYLQRCWKAPHASSMCAHHTIEETKRVHREWLEETPEKKDVSAAVHDVVTATGRPLWRWSKKKRGKAKTSAYNLFVRERYGMMKATMSRKLLEPLALFHIRVMKRLAKRWKEMAGDNKKTWKDKAILVRQVTALRPDAMATYVKTMEDAKAVETTGSPWGLPDLDFPVAEAILIKARKDAASKQTGKRKSFMKEHSESWHKEHGCFIDNQFHLPGALGVRTPCGEIASTCLNSHTDEVLQLKDDIVKLLKEWVAPNCVVTRGRGTMLQLWSDNSSDLAAMLACVCSIVLLHPCHTQTFTCIH